VFILITLSVADPDPGCLFTPGSQMGKKSGSGFGMNNPDHISDSLETGIRNLKNLDPRWKNLDQGWKNSVHGSGRKILTRDDKHPGSATLITFILPQKNNFSKHRSNVVDLECLSRIRLVSFPDPGSELSPSRIRIKEFKYLNPKNGF
jgi:hypothetical protein